MSYESRTTIHGQSALSAAVTARRVFADFALFVKKLSTALAELFAAAVLELADGWMIGESVFHGGLTSKITLREPATLCM
jgi:hypothetical protein